MPVKNFEKFFESRDYHVFTNEEVETIKKYLIFKLKVSLKKYHSEDGVHIFLFEHPCLNFEDSLYVDDEYIELLDKRKDFLLDVDKLADELYENDDISLIINAIVDNRVSYLEIVLELTEKSPLMDTLKSALGIEKFDL